jgi:hypothetical protein
MDECTPRYIYRYGTREKEYELGHIQYVQYMSHVVYILRGFFEVNYLLLYRTVQGAWGKVTLTVLYKVMYQV